MSYVFGSNCASISSSLGITAVSNSLLEVDLQTVDEIEHASVINGNRNYITKGDYCEFNLIVNLFKYDNPTTALNLLNSFYHQYVKFIPFDGVQTIVSGSNSIPVDFYVSDIVPYYLYDTKNDDDLVRMTFKATKYVDLNQLITGLQLYLLTEDGNQITSEDGTPLKGKVLSTE